MADDASDRSKPPADRPRLHARADAPPRDPRRPPVRRGQAPKPPARGAPPVTTPRGAIEPRAPARDTPRPAARNRPAPIAAPRAVAAAPRRTAPPNAAAPNIAAPNIAAPNTASPPTGVRVSKLLAERGVASRREADDWIDAGFVRVDGRAVVLGERVAPDAAIDIDPRARAEQSRRVTVLLHKPIGYVSGQAEDGHTPALALVTPANRWSGDASRIDFRPAHLRHLAPAGRLDIDSTGLLVFTQDGRIARRLIGDETRVEKEYLVRVAWAGDERPGDATLARLRHGLELDGVALRPAQVSWQNDAQLRIVLREGRKRQIRRMCEAVGLQVTALKRVRIGSVVLGALPSGQWRYLRDDERF